MIARASRWAVRPAPDPEVVTSLAGALNLPETLALLLAQRGITSVEAARAFLRPSLAAFTDPMTLPDMDRAVEVIAGAARARQTILIHGDYDVDGQCATVLLTRVLGLTGARVIPFVPHRLRDGYDFGPAGIAAARAHGAQVIVTCDCATTAVGPVAQAKAEGFQVVVTDHHLTNSLPPADAVVNPNRADCDSAGKALCGTGVAFKLAQALVTELELPAFLPLHLLDLVALATVADIVPLRGENRVLVRFGLKTLAESRWPGVRALIRSAGLAGRPLRAGHVGFLLAPRLNAAGRIGDAMDGVRLLLSDDDGEATRMAQALEVLNTERQSMDQQILAEAEAEIERTVDLDRDYGLVLARDGWHPGVIGIVASRVVERYGRPTILIGLDGPEGRGSGRSIPGFDLHAALTRCAPHLNRFGGHRMAAGLSLHRDRLADFRDAFNAAVHGELSEADLIPTQTVDAVVTLAELTEDLERLLRHLEPCGPGNPTPVFGIEGARVGDARTVGRNHLRFVLDDGTARLGAIGFDWADRVGEGWSQAPLDVALRLETNEWGGRSDLQARVVQLRPTA
jgi:single-stranded-DNA-specific exonuclease